VDPWLLNTLTFLAAFLAVLAANAVLLDRTAGDRRRLNQELQEQLRQRVRQRIKLEDVSQIARMAKESKSTRRQWLMAALDQSGLNMSVNRFLLTTLAVACTAGLLFGGLTESPLLGMFAAMAGAALPLLRVLYARQKRLEKLLSQLPDAFDLMSRVLRAGQTISQAMQLVADEFAPPISLEFFRCQEQMNLGLAPEDALRDLSQRTGLLELKIFAVAVLVQRQTGGNLSELFDKMGTLVRDRYRIRGMIQSLTAQGRMQAVILLSLPVAMFALLMAIQPDYERVLLNYPLLILAALTMMALGALWIHKIMHFDY
jgi:tight adherence protein B